LAQIPSPFCTNCRAPLQEGQEFCTNCGTTINRNANRPTERASNRPQNSSSPERPVWANPNTPPPPENRAYPNFPQQPPPPSSPGYTPYPNNQPGPSFYPNNQSQNRIPEYNAQVPQYAQKPKRRSGCLITSSILLLILLAGIGGLVYLHFSGSQTTKTSRSSGLSTGSSTGGLNSTTPSAPTISSSEQLNLSFIYASVNMTVLSTQEASNFPDDTSSNGNAAVVRVNLQENNTTAHNPDYAEGETLLLVLPDGNTLKPSNEQAGISPEAGVKRTIWIDFGLSSKVTLSQLVLRMGPASQNQMNIPLQPGADLSQYQDKTVNPNDAFQYAGLNWTLKTATLSYSYASQQATTGNRYVIITLSAVNSTSDGFEDGTGSYTRLQTDGNSSPPDSTTTFPTSVPANASSSGVLAFLVPQDAHSFTLVMLAQSTSPPIVQVTQAFQIQ
jgi:zinc-ribbon domain